MFGVLVVCLLSGLVVMHHVSAAGSHGAATTMSGAGSVDAAVPGVAALPRLADPQGVSHPDDGDGGVGSILLHLCLAILTGAALILAASLGWRRTVYWSIRSALQAIRPAPAPRAPPPSAPARLALLCVMRT